MVPAIAYVVLHAVTALFNFLSFSCACVSLSSGYDVSWKINTGCKATLDCNIQVLGRLSVLVLMLFYLATFVLELLLCMSPWVRSFRAFEKFRGGFVRAGVYMACAVLLLSVSGDFGIAMGSLCFIMGTVWLIHDFLVKFGCIASEAAPGSPSAAGAQRLEAV